MRRWTRNIWNYLTAGWSTRRARHAPIRRSRLDLEYLEDRTVLSTTQFTGTLTGVAFLDTNANGTLDKGELTMPGAKVSLNGTLTTAINNTITAASWANGVATLTTSVEHVLQVGAIVTISGMTPAGYNGTFTVTKVPSATTFTFKLATNPGKATAFGTATETGLTISTTTNKSGTYTFDNVLPGAYTLTAAAVRGLVGGTTPNPVTTTLTPGDVDTNNLAYTGKLSSSSISLALYLTETTSVGHSFGPVAKAPDIVNVRADNTPTVSTAIAAQSVSLNAANTQIDLAGHFTDPDYTNSQVTFNIIDGTKVTKVVLNLFDNADPQTVANFFDYINSGSYDNGIFHRLVTSGIDILQAGAVSLTPNGTTQSVTLTNPTANTTKFTLSFAGATTTPITFTGDATTDQTAIQNALLALNTVNGTVNKGGTVTVTEGTSGHFTIVFGGALANSAQPKLVGRVTTAPGTIATSIVTTLSNIPILSPGSTGVPSEFPTATSPPKQNVAGTIAMALSGSPSNPNSGTDQFFFNIGDNSSSLDSQKFTTFGKIASISTTTLAALGKTPTKNVTNSTLTTNFPTADFQNIPLVNYHGSSTTFPGDATPNNFMRINSVTVNKRDEFLTYSVVSNSNPSLVTPSVTNEWLSLHYATGVSGTATITVKATDRFGASVTQTFTVTVNGPTVTGVSFTDNDPTNQNVTSLTATPTSADPTSGATVSFTYQWLRNGQPIAGATNQTLNLNTVPSLTATDTLSVTVTPTDSKGIAGAAFTSKTVTLVTAHPFTLALPTVSSVAIAADNASSATSLTATPTSPADPEGQTITYSYQWLHNGQPISGATSQTLQLSSVTVTQGDTFAVKVTPSDGVLTGTVFTSGQVGVSGTNPTQIAQPPTISSVTFQPGNPLPTDQLTANVTAADPQSLPLTYTYVWTDDTDGATLQTTSASSSASDTLDLSKASITPGDTVSVAVTVNDGTLTSAVATTSVQVTGPVITNVTFTDNNPADTNVTTLTAQPQSIDATGETVTYGYQWLLNGTTPIANATAATLDLTSVAGLTAGDRLSVVVTPSDSSGVTGAAFTSKAVHVTTVSPTTLALPTVTSVAIAADSASSATTLTATPTSPADPEGEAIGYAYQWLQNGVPIAGATSQTLQLSSVTVATNDKFTVEVTPSDSVLTGPTFTSNPVGVAATSPTQIVQQPTISAVNVTPPNPQTTDTLTASVTAADPQSRTLTYTYVWTDVTTGATLQTTNASTNSSDTLNLSGTSVVANDTVSVKVTVNNGVLDSQPTTTSVPVA